MFDLSTLPVSGSLIIGCALYAGASIVAGQVVSDRMIARSDWATFCNDALHADIERRKTPETVVPETDCESVVGRWHPDLNRLCWQFGNPDLAGPGAEVAREAERMERELEQRRLRAAAAGAATRCDCAANVYRRDHLFAFGIYAGSGRMFTPPQVESLRSGLQDALYEPICGEFTGGAW